MSARTELPTDRDDAAVVDLMLPLFLEVEGELEKVLEGRAPLTIWQLNAKLLGLGESVSATLTEKQWRVIRAAVRFLIQELAKEKGEEGNGAKPVMSKSEWAAIIGGNVAAIRRELGMTQQNLASELACSVPAVSRLESGRHLPTLWTLLKIAEALELDPQRILAVKM